VVDGLARKSTCLRSIVSKSPPTGLPGASVATSGRTRRVKGGRIFCHATDELIVVPEGGIKFEIAGRVRHPKAGEELLIPAEAVHSARNIGTTTARW